jgi:ribonuclease HI
MTKKTTDTRTRPMFGEARQERPQAFLVAHVDGGARGNPGPAGYGVVIEDEAGREIARLHRFLGHRTNNYAEYSGLLAALEYALEHKTGLEVWSDSELIVRQLNGQYKVRHPELKVLYEQARGIIRQLGWFKIRHVRREQNREADRLANEAMDRGK